MLLKVSAYFLLFLLRHTYTYDDVSFLASYFQHEAVTITVNVCWDFRRTKKFVKDLLDTKIDKSFVIHGKSTRIEFFRNLVDNNGFVLDLRSCPSSFKLLIKAASLNLFESFSKYLLLTDQDGFGFGRNITGYLPILPNSHVIVAKFEEDSVQLYQPFKPTTGSEMIWEEKSCWSPTDGWEDWSIDSSSRRFDLQGANFTIGLVIFHNDSWNHLEDLSHNSIDAMTKQSFPALKAALEWCNTTINLKGYDSYGYIDGTSAIFSGLVGGLKNGEVQFSGSSIFFTEDRFRAVDFTCMLNPLPIRFLVRKPSTSYMKNIFFITFRWTVWIATFAVALLFMLVLYVILNWEKNNEERHVQENFTMSDVALIALESVCQQGTYMEPRSSSGRITAFMLFITFMFLYVSYSAYIVVLLQSTMKIETLDDLLKSRIEVGGLNMPYMKNYFEAPKKGVLRQLYLQKIYPNSYFPMPEGLRKVQEGNFAFHIPLGEGYDYISKKFTNYEICGLQELPGYTEFYRGYVPVPKHSPYKEIIKVGVAKVIEHGIRTRYQTRVMAKPTCYSQTNSFKNVGMYDCYEMFLVWLTGVFFAWVILILEFIMHKIKFKLVE